MGKQEEDFEEELDMDVDVATDDDDDLDIDMDDDSQGDGRLQSTSKRVRMIFSVMASPNRIDILRILNSKGPLTYSELKSLAGFKSKKESGKFAYHLRKLLRQSLVALNKSERRYTITNLGKLVLSLARQIEERSIIESGKMYVRTSHDSIEEFNSDKIIQSLVREGSLPLELSQKITEEVENRIYKFQTTYLTGSLIREMVNNVLLEHGHEEYRNKLARLGMPVFEVQEMFTNVENIQNGVEDILFTSGKNTLAEYLLTNTLPKDIADSHLSGELHISNLGLWSLITDTIFLSLKELIEDGIELKGKCPSVARISAALQGREQLTTIPSTRIAAEAAYKMAGITAKDVDFAEVHDCFTVAEVVDSEDLGFFEKGTGATAARNGDTKLNGSISINPSGGLKSKGHPIGATGVGQVVEAFEQLTGKSGERTVNDAKIGLTQNFGATGASCAVHIFQSV